MTPRLSNGSSRSAGDTANVRYGNGLDGVAGVPVPLYA
jgi:hypothetical protein